MKRIHELILATLLLATPVTQTFAGSGIGGGMTLEQMSWCDETSVMIEETREAAISHLSSSGDKVGALKIFYNGYVNAADASDQTDTSLENLLTYRSVVRGIRVAQLIGIPQIINGAPAEAGLSGVKQIQGMLSFMDWYSLTINQGANAVDRSQYGRRDGRFSTLALEDAMVNLAVNQLQGLSDRFVALKSDRSSYVPLIPITQYLAALSFISNELAGDLSETVFSNALGCQSARLVKLSRQIESFLSTRMNASGDMSALNKFTLAAQSIANQISHRTCTR